MGDHQAVNCLEFLNELQEQGIECSSDGSDLLIRSPKGALSAAQKEQIALNKAELLRIVPGRGQQVELAPDLERRYEPFPLSDIQQAYWLGRNSAFELGKTGIHVYEELECRGLDIDRLNSSWKKVVERHDSLRAVVQSDGWQKVLPTASYQLEVVDLRGEPALIAQQALSGLRDRLSHKVYAAEVWPMFDIVACRLDNETTRLLISIDALHVDMRSFQVIFSDWVHFYSNQAELPPITVTYRDYVLALKQLSNDKRFLVAREFWDQKVIKLEQSPQLPLTKPLSLVKDQKFKRLRGELPVGSWTRLKQRAASVNATPSSIALAAYCEVLSLWSVKPDFTINVTLFNALPLHKDIGDVAGDFTSVILVSREGSEAGFATRVRRLQKEIAEGLKHRFVSGIEVLRGFSKFHGMRPGQAVMPVVFTSTLNNETQGILPLKSFGQRIYNIIQTPQVLLDLQVYEEEGKLCYQWDYVEELFPEGLAEDMFAAYEHLLYELSDCLDWDSASLVAIPERQSARRVQINDTSANFPKQSLPDVCWNPDSLDLTAVVTSSLSLTKRDVQLQALEIAGWLAQHGLKAGEVVGILMSKCWQQVVAVHGVLLAGGVYVPADAGAPVTRAQSVLSESGCRFVLTTAEIRDSRAWAAKNVPVCAEDWNECVLPSPLLQTDPSDLAYLLYTSGSTGVPKGVMIEHRSVVNRMTDVNRRYGITARDRVFAITALHHDLSVYDLFGSLMAGAAMVLPDAARHRDPEHWAQIMLEAGVTVWNSVPAFLEMLVEFLERCPDPTLIPTGLRLVLLAGDWIPVSLPTRLRALIPNVEFIAMGGPTETTVWDICFPVAQVCPEWKSIPYGRPMANATYFVLDEHMRERPDWVPGELCIGGTGLARGYWNDPAATNAKFVTYPETGQRIYRSGDIGRFLPDGNIEFLGRVDSQLKIGGHRIEAGEVEAVLTNHPGVLRALVEAAGENGKPKKLMAYIVPAKSQSPPGNPDLRAASDLEFRLRKSGLFNDHACSHIALQSTDDRNSPTYQNRKSTRSFLSQPVPWVTFTELLRSLQGFESKTHLLPKYRYPSAGSLYPVRTYVLVRESRVEGLRGGAYYYHPVENRLSFLSSDQLPASAHEEHNRCLAEDLAFSLYFIGHLPAIEPIYRERSRDFCLIEAGYMGQLLMMEAERNRLGACPIGHLNTSALESLLQLKPEADVFLHGMACGLPSAGETAKCVVPANQEQRLARELREWVQKSLPDYMTPSRFHFLEQLPVTPNGKVDRRALEFLDAGERVKPLELPPAELPGTKLEKEVARVVREVLNETAVPITARFFEIGCNSIHLISILSRLRATVAPDLMIADLFAWPTVQLLAKRIAESSSGQSEAQSSRQRGSSRRLMVEQQRGR